MPQVQVPQVKTEQRHRGRRPTERSEREGANEDGIYILAAGFVPADKHRLRDSSGVSCVVFTIHFVLSSMVSCCTGVQNAFMHMILLCCSWMFCFLE